MSNSKNRPWHLFLETVDHTQQVSGVVEPVRWAAQTTSDGTFSETYHPFALTIIALNALVQDPTRSLMRTIRNPYGSDIAPKSPM